MSKEITLYALCFAQYTVLCYIINFLSVQWPACSFGVELQLNTQRQLYTRLLIHTLWQYRLASSEGHVIINQPYPITHSEDACHSHLILVVDVSPLLN